MHHLKKYNQKCLGLCDSAPPFIFPPSKQNLSSTWRETTTMRFAGARQDALCGDHNYWQPCVKIMFVEKQLQVSLVRSWIPKRKRTLLVKQRGNCLHNNRDRMTTIWNSLLCCDFIFSLDQGWATLSSNRHGKSCVKIWQLPIHSQSYTV